MDSSRNKDRLGMPEPITEAYSAENTGSAKNTS